LDLTVGKLSLGIEFAFILQEDSSTENEALGTELARTYTGEGRA